MQTTGSFIQHPISQLLPKPARDALIHASTVGEPESMKRLIAIEMATAVARQKYPQFFQVEVFTEE